MKNKTIIAGLAALIIVSVGTLAVTSNISAQDTSFGPSNLIQRITQRFNLDQDEVEEVFTEYRGEMRQAKLEKHEEHLDELVSEGVITEAQKQELLELKADVNGDFSAHKEQMQQWFEDNDLDPKDLFSFEDHKGYRFMHFAK